MKKFLFQFDYQALILHSEVHNSPGNELGAHCMLGCIKGGVLIWKNGDVIAFVYNLNEDDIPGTNLPKPTEQCNVPVLKRCSSLSRREVEGTRSWWHQ